MWRSYFRDKNYLAFYLHSFGDNIANKLAEIFTGAYLYSVGMPLHFIFLFWGLEFGLRGLLAPLGPKLFSKIGLTKTILLSYSSFIVYFVVIGAAKESLIIGFSAFIFHSIARAIYYPCIDALHAVLIQDGTRGRQNSLELVIASGAGILAVALGTVTLLHYSFWALAAIAAVILALAASTLLGLDPVAMPATNFKDSYRYLASPEFKPYLLPLGAYSIAIIANIFAAPLFIFIAVGKIETFGAVIGTAIAVQMLIALTFGAAVDKWRQPRLALIVVSFQSIGNIAYLFLRTNTFTAFLTKAWNDTAWSTIRNNFETRIQTEGKRSGSPFLFAAALQMTLCFVEVIALVLLALVALWRPMLAFPAVFLASVLSLWIAERYLFGEPLKG